MQLSSLPSFFSFSLSFAAIACAASVGHARPALGTYRLCLRLSPLAAGSNDISLQIVPESLTQIEREDIVKYFKNIPRAKRGKTNHFDFMQQEKPPWFVKYGGNDLLDEASTQFFFHTLAQGDSSAPRIPAVYSAFRGEGYYFLVMEKVDMPTLETCDIPEADAVQSVASAVGWLLNQMPLVPSTIFGRISARKTRVWHRFFKDRQAPVPFVSSEAVGKYVNKA